MSFFGIGKKKLDEQSREEQSAETAKVQKEQASEDAPQERTTERKDYGTAAVGGFPAPLREV